MTAPAESFGTALEWHRVALGFVSAYILVRRGEAVVVDTGVEGSVAAIETSLSRAGLGWGDVAHVILTHKHHDHVGSLGPVLERAPKANAYAGEGDLAAISSPREVTPLSDGDRIFDLQIVATPGHTPGHLSVLDPDAGLLVAGDAIRSEDGEVIGPNPRFTEDMDVAIQSVRKLGGFEYATAVFGHGDPVDPDASNQVSRLADRL